VTKLSLIPSAFRPKRFQPHVREPFEPLVARIYFDSNRLQGRDAEDGLYIIGTEDNVDGNGLAHEFHFRGADVQRNF
jgi:hypothetical protein